MTVTLSLVIAALLLVLFGLVVWVIKRTERSHEQREAEDERHRRESDSLQAGHSRALAEEQQRHRSEVQAAADAHAAQMRASSQDHRSELSALREQVNRRSRLQAKAVFAAAQGMKWELASRELLVDACVAARLDAIVATNVVFAPVETSAEPFCAQIDHLVFTDHAIIVVENKHWAGMIFDGIRPTDHMSALATVMNDDHLEPPFAVHISRSSRALLEVRVDSDGQAPAHQVRRQALRLRRLLRSAGSPPLIDTCVFYSHAGAHVVTAGSYLEGHMQTEIATPQTLPATLTKIHDNRGRLDPAQLNRAIATIQELGADLVGVGRFAADHTSPVELSYRIREKRARKKSENTAPRKAGR